MLGGIPRGSKDVRAPLRNLVPHGKRTSSCSSRSAFIIHLWVAPSHLDGRRSLLPAFRGSKPDTRRFRAHGRDARGTSGDRSNPEGGGEISRRRRLRDGYPDRRKPTGPSVLTIPQS